MTSEWTSERMAALHSACFSVPRPWSAAEITELLASPRVFLVAESVGFAMGRIAADEVELLTLAVDPEQRRRGTGRRLVAAFLEGAHGAGAARAFLEVMPDNAAAIALYLKAGFAVCGRRKGYYRPATGAAVDALIMDRAV